MTPSAIKPSQQKGKLGCCQPGPPIRADQVETVWIAAHPSWSVAGENFQPGLRPTDRQLPPKRRTGQSRTLAAPRQDAQRVRRDRRQRCIGRVYDGTWIDFDPARRHLARCETTKAGQAGSAPKSAKSAIGVDSATMNQYFILSVTGLGLQSHVDSGSFGGLADTALREANVFVRRDGRHASRDVPAMSGPRPATLAIGSVRGKSREGIREPVTSRQTCA